MMKGNYLKQFVAAAFVALLSAPVFATEVKRMTLTNVSDVSIVIVPKGCTKTEEHWLWGETKKEVDCMGILLKDAQGSNDFSAGNKLGNVLILPASLEVKTATEYVSWLAIALGKREEEGTTIKLSQLSYIEKEISLSELTKDDNDTILVKLGGIVLYRTTVIDQGSSTLTLNNTIRMGIGAN